MRVLLGIGGTQDSIKALDRTLRRAVEAHDDVTIAVLENPQSDRSVEEVRRLVLGHLEEAGLSADLRHLSGDPGPEITELAERGDYDEVVLGGGKQSPMGKLTIGPIAEFILLNGDITVTLVR